MEFKVGQKVKVLECFYGEIEHKGQAGVIERIDSDDRYGVRLNSGVYCSSKKVELITNSNTPMRKRYILKKETYQLKKDAIVEEICDDGTQEFTLITPESDKFPDGRGWKITRKAVTNNPKWFQQVEPLYVPADKLAKVKKILKLK